MKLNLTEITKISPTKDSKNLHFLEYPKILARLADFYDFSASAELARTLQPTPGRRRLR